MLDIRRDPIVGAWVLVRDLVDVTPSYQPLEDNPSATCIYCAGNERRTPVAIYEIKDQADDQWRVRVVPHQNPRLQIEVDYKLEGVGFYDTVSRTGAHEMIIETPEHGIHICQLPLEQIVWIIRTYQMRLEDLRKDKRIRYVLLFKRREYRLSDPTSGHCISQILGIPAMPLRIKTELETARRFFSYKERCLFCDIIDQELHNRARFVAENESMIAFCPFAARFPFEVWIMPKEHQHDFCLMDSTQIYDLSVMIKKILGTLKTVLNNPPYDYILHTSPNPIPHRGYWRTLYEDYHWRIEIIPRLFNDLGFEYSTGFYINNTSPEAAAEALRTKLI